MASIIAFLVFVAPGIPWSERVEGRQSWRKEDGTFRQISKGVIWSAWFSLPATALTLLLMRCLIPTQLSELRAWLLAGGKLHGWNVVSLLGAAYLELLVAWGFMNVAWRLFASRLYGNTDASSRSAWETFLHHDDELVRVMLTDGRSCIGTVLAFSTDNEWSFRELVVATPVLVDKDGSVGKPFEGVLILPSISIIGVFAMGNELLSPPKQITKVK